MAMSFALWAWHDSIDDAITSDRKARGKFVPNMKTDDAVNGYTYEKRTCTKLFIRILHCFNRKIGPFKLPCLRLDSPNLTLFLAGSKRFSLWRGEWRGASDPRAAPRNYQPILIKENGI